MIVTDRLVLGAVDLGNGDIFTFDLCGQLLPGWGQALAVTTP